MPHPPQSKTCELGVRYLHLFNRHDQAVECGRIRRGITGPYPGNACVLGPRADGRLECVAADGAKHTSANHDYGQVDGLVLIEKRDWLGGILPAQRLLKAVEEVPPTPAHYRLVVGD